MNSSENPAMNFPTRAADRSGADACSPLRADASVAEAAVLALEHAMVADPAVVALGEDLGRGGIFGQYRGLRERFGAQRVLDTPISEATIVGAAVGMSLTGLRPVVELRVMDFALCAADEVVNQAAKNRFMFGGQGRLPMVLRMPIGVWTGSAAQHSQSLEAWFAHIPGLVVVAPTTPADTYALLRAAIVSDDPVVFLEHKERWAVRGSLAGLGADGSSGPRLAQAALRREGSTLTLVAWSRAVDWSLEAATILAEEGIDVEVIDLLTLWPWDRERVLTSVARTGRLLVVHEAVQTAGFGGEIAATVAEETGLPVARLGAPRLPVGYAPVLEAVTRIDAQRVVDKIRAWRSRW